MYELIVNISFRFNKINLKFIFDKNWVIYPDRLNITLLIKYRFYLLEKECALLR